MNKEQRNTSIFMAIACILLLVIIIFAISKCEPGEPYVYEPEYECFDNNVLCYKYMDGQTVMVAVKEGEYRLVLNGDNVRAPFRYEFEDDGDVDIIYRNREYEIDSPYDFDGGEFILGAAFLERSKAKKKAKAKALKKKKAAEAAARKAAAKKAAARKPVTNTRIQKAPTSTSSTTRKTTTKKKSSSKRRK